MPLWYQNSRRWCVFSHKWQVRSISRERFEVVEQCSWCNQSRTRALKPQDELNRRFDAARYRGQDRRKVLVNELKYERAKGRTANADRIKEILRELSDARQTVMAEIKKEKIKGAAADPDRIKELQHELRGLFWGKN